MGTLSPTVGIALVRRWLLGRAWRRVEVVARLAVSVSASVNLSTTLCEIGRSICSGKSGDAWQDVAGSNRAGRRDAVVGEVIVVVGGGRLRLDLLRGWPGDGD
jgi:hypothetical protein